MGYQTIRLHTCPKRKRLQTSDQHIAQIMKFMFERRTSMGPEENVDCQ